jgi:ATP/maltotriose-dependent transcriptional regulator MalT
VFGGWSYFMRGFLSVLLADPAAARSWLERASSAGRQSGDVTLVVHALSMGSVAERTVGERDSALRMLDEARALQQTMDDPAATLAVLQARTLLGFFDGDLEQVRAAALEGIELARRVNDLYALEVMLGELAGPAVLMGDADAARPLYEEGLRIARRIDDRLTEFYYLDSLACVAALTGQGRRAANLLGASQSMRAAAGASAMAFMAPLTAQAEELATAALGPRRFQAELEAGRGLSRQAALSLALGESSRPSAAASPHPDKGLLGKRETDVARLVAEGFSNKEIAARLFISQRTVDTHVHSILNKLGFSSRAQIAAWMAAERQ